MSSLGFSYAQAAKGLAPSSNVSSNPASSASSEHGIKDTNPVTESSTNNSRYTRPSKTEKEHVHQQRSATNNVAHNEVNTSTSQEKPAFQTVDSNADDCKSMRSQQSSTEEFVVSSKANDASAATAAPAADEQEDNVKDSSETSDVPEKAKDADDDWEKVSIPSSAAEKELKAAPIPAVNIWQQRLETQQAKLKEQSIQRQPSLNQASAKPSTQQVSSDDSKKKGGSRENVTSDNVRTSPGRINAGSRAARDQRGASTSPRSTSQQKEQSVKQPPPPVDVASWPTPESAIVDTGRRIPTLDKGEKTDVADVKPSSRKNQWTTLPFVPSVKFETQIPTNRRGGRAGNARGGGRAASNAQGERNSEKAEPGSMGPPPLPKPTSEQDRGRKGHAARSNRASSVPTEVPPAESAVDRPYITEPTSAKEPTTTASPPRLSVSQENSKGLENSSSKDLSGSSSRQAASGTLVATRQKTDAEQPSAQTTDAVESPAKQTYRPEKYTNSTFDNSRSANEAGEKTSKDWPKDRTNKADSWRPEQRGERSERGRGSYRGRGNRSSYTNASFTSPLPQNGFETSKHGPNSDARANRQSSQTYGTPSFRTSQNNTRAQSIPVGMLQGAYFSPPQGFPQTLAPIQTDMSYAYGQMPNGMPGGIMSAIPYNEPLNGYALISMVSRQLEYYFSLDNLCKDMFLRRNMDSQGFVLLRVIAEFRRIKTLLGEGSMSYEHLRGVAAQVPNTEYVTGEDGEDRLRSRGNWKDFVLPMEERVSQAQNEGPQIKSTQPHQLIGIPPDFHMGNGLRSAPPSMNGFQDAFMSHHAPMPFAHGLVAEPQTTEPWQNRAEGSQLEDRRASVTSPGGKIQSPGLEPKALYGSMTNGHRDSMSSNPPGKENTFPDENIALLKVVVKDPEYQGHEESSLVEEALPNQGSGLRGGAGSPEQLERIRGLQFGQAQAVLKKSSEQTMYFTQGEGPRPELMRPGYIHEDYVTLREQAFNQRAENHFNGALLVLYPLWADFLAMPHQFNIGMYEEFKTWALEDQRHGDENGKKHLVKFYDTMLNSHNAMTERLANDIVNIARNESGSNRQTWLKLRGAWRNGATNLKTRKRLADLLTAEEREELDRNT